MLSEFRYSTTVIDMMSWRGLGKTRIPERSQARLDHPQIAIVEGDMQTSNSTYEAGGWKDRRIGCRAR